MIINNTYIRMYLCTYPYKYIGPSGAYGTCDSGSVYYPCCDEKRYIHICMLNIRTGPEIAVCHLPLSTYMYNTTKVTSLFDVCMLGTYIRENGRQQHTDPVTLLSHDSSHVLYTCSPFMVFQ